MNALQFIQHFPNEESCKNHFRLHREQQGIYCKKCLSSKQYWLQAKSQWQCAQCDFRTTIRSGTVMQGSNLPIRKWYLAMAFISETKVGLSAKELQRQLNHKRYDTIWSLMHRIRNAMGNKEDLENCTNGLTFNEYFFHNAQPDGRKLKRGRANASKFVRKSKHLHSQKEPINPTLNTSTNQWKIQLSIPSERCNKKLFTELNERYFSFSNSWNKDPFNIFEYIKVKKKPSGIIEENPYVRSRSKKMITQARRVILGIHHKIRGKYLPLYLDDFCFKLNHQLRKKGMFDSLVSAVSQSFWIGCRLI